MKILVIGGNGLIGSKVVKNLRQLGYDVVAGSPRTGINTVTGEGLADALNGTHVVIDASNAPSFDDQAVLDFFETSGRHLLAAEARAGVRHHIALSIVGTDRMLGSGYFRAKMAQENLIKASGIPYTIVRSTQFFEFLDGIAQYGTVDNEVRLTTAQLQPIAADDIAMIVSDTALAHPLNATIDAAGPEKFRLASLMQTYLAKCNDPRTVIADDEAGYFGMPIGDQSLTPDGNARLGTTRFDAWFTKSQAAT